RKNFGDGSADRDNEGIVVGNSIRDKPWNAVAQATPGIVPSSPRRPQIGEQIGARKILSKHVHRVPARRTDDSVETDNADVSLPANVHRVVDSRQVSRIEGGSDDAIESAVGAHDAAGKLDGPFARCRF